MEFFRHPDPYDDRYRNRTCEVILILLLLGFFLYWMKRQSLGGNIYNGASAFDDTNANLKTSSILGPNASVPDIARELWTRGLYFDGTPLSADRMGFLDNVANGSIQPPPKQQLPDGTIRYVFPEGTIFFWSPFKPGWQYRDSYDV